MNYLNLLKPLAKPATFAAGTALIGGGLGLGAKLIQEIAPEKQGRK